MHKNKASVTWNGNYSRPKTVKGKHAGRKPHRWPETYRLVPNFKFESISGRLKSASTKLINARAYRTGNHLVIKVRSTILLQQYAPKTVLSRINSGSIYQPTPRGNETFVSINSWPEHVNRKGRLRLQIAEVAVHYGVSDLIPMVDTVHEVNNGIIGHKIWPN